MSLVAVPIFGTYEPSPGVYSTGRVVFTATTEFTDGTTVVSPSREIVFDLVGGSIPSGAQLWATDFTSGGVRVDPQNVIVTYQVLEQLDGNDQNLYWIQVPAADAGGGLNLATAVRVPPPGTVITSVLTGPAGPPGPTGPTGPPGPSGDGFYLVGSPTGTDDRANFAAAYAACPAGGVILFYAGQYFLDPVSITKQVGIAGQGEWSTYITPYTSGATGNFFEFNLPAPGGSVFDYYGPSVKDLSLNLYNSPACTGIRLNQYTGWARVRDVAILGANTGIGISNAGTNNRIEDTDLLDCGVMIHIDADTGLELTLDNIQCGRNTSGTTTRVIECIAATYSANKGALYMNKVKHSSGTSGGVVTNGGLYMYAPPPPNNATNPCSMPLFATGCVLDDMIGGNAGIEFENVADINFSDGWVNCGASTGGAVVKIGGCLDLKFSGNKFFGGGAGGTYRTYEFTNGSGTGTYCTRGVVSKDNYCPTNYVYYFPGAPQTNYMSDLIADDYIIGGGIGFAASNDMTQMQLSRMERFGSAYFNDQQVFRLPVFPGGVASFDAALVNGVVTITDALADGTLSRYLPVYYSIIGTPGFLRQSAISTGVNFTITSYTSAGAVNTADQSVITVLVYRAG